MIAQTNGTLVQAASIAAACGMAGLAAMPTGVARWGTWVLFGLLLLGTLMNLASASLWERYFWAPYALVLAVLCFVAARGSSS